MIKAKVRDLIGHKKLKSRSGQVLVNLSASIVFKMINMLISFFMVPITLGYLDKTRYGLWAAISSLLAWFFIFDIGIGSGLKNRIIELKAQDRIDEIKSYVSTSYAMFGCIVVISITAFLILNRALDWASILNAPTSLNHEISVTISITFVVLCLMFVLKLLNTILAADLKNAVSNGFTVISHVISFIGILFLSRFTTPSLLKYALIYTGANLTVQISATIFLFSGMYRSIAPSFRNIDWSLSKNLMGVGIKFFFVQIGAMILFQSMSFIISSFVNPEAVTDYNIHQKYFSMVAMVFYMMANPLWSGFGDAYHKGEHRWIKNTFSRLLKLWILIIVIMASMVCLQDIVFSIWLKGRVQVDYILSFLIVLHFSLQIINTIYNPFINATGKLRLSITMLPAIVLLFLGLAYWFTHDLELGAKGVLIALIIAQGIPAAILSPIQSYKILKGAKGIWNK